MADHVWTATGRLIEQSARFNLPMSSLIGHLSAGAAVYLSQARLKSPQTGWALPLLFLLAILPDFDYLAYWLFGFHSNSRFTHSLAFCLTASGLAWLVMTRLSVGRATPIGFGALALASCSHLGLDLLVGVHSLPVFWPLPVAELSVPFGLLPSAGYPSFRNYYLWRNLAIELGVLLPLFAFLVAMWRGRLAWPPFPRLLLPGALWLGFLVWSISTHS